MIKLHICTYEITPIGISVSGSYDNVIFVVELPRNMLYKTAFLTRSRNKSCMHVVAHSVGQGCIRMVGADTISCGACLCGYRTLKVKSVFRLCSARVYNNPHYIKKKNPFFLHAYFFYHF